MKSKSKLIIVLLLVTIIAVAGAFALHHYMIKDNMDNTSSKDRKSVV